MNRRESEREREDIACLLRLAGRQARCAGVADSEVDDSALEFAEFVLKRRQGNSEETGRWFEGAFLTQCAKRHSWRFARRLARHVSQCLSIDDAPDVGERARLGANPCFEAVTHDLCQRITGLILILDSRDRDLFVRHHLDDQPLASIAEERGDTPNALAQRLYRIRSRLRKQLLVMGS
jgi:hypothetical protein